MKKTIALGIIFLFIGCCVVPSFVGKQCDLTVDEEIPLESSMVSEWATVSIHTFDRTGEKQKDVVISTNAAHEINGMLEELKYKITYEPLCDDTRTLKKEFVDLLEVYGLIPEELSKSYLLSLLNPSWLDNIQKTSKLSIKFPILRDFISHIFDTFIKLQHFFKIRFANDDSLYFDENIKPVSPYDETGTAILCSIFSGGNGIILPYFMLPRPRGVAMWRSGFSYTDIVNILSGDSIWAAGAQQGFALGFMGLGFTYYIPGFTVFYALIGYALLISVRTEYIEYHELPNNVPIVSDEKK